MKTTLFSPLQSSRRDRDSNYSPKVTLGSVGPRRDRAQLRRDHARVAGVERGLQAAREEEGQAQGEARKRREDKKVIITFVTCGDSRQVK